MADELETKKPGRWRLLRSLALVLFSAALLAGLLVATGVSPARLGHAMAGADFRIILAVAVCSALWHIFAGADKLYRVLVALGAGGERVTLGAVVRLRLGAGPFRVFLPIDADDVLAALYLWRGCGVPPELASGAALFDSGLNLLGTGFWLLLGLSLWGGHLESSQAVLAVLVAGGYLLFIFLTPAHRLIIRLAEGMSPKAGKIITGVVVPFSRTSPGRKLFLVAYGIFFQARQIFTCYFLFGAFGFWLSPGQIIAPVSLCALAGHVPSAAGIGPREAAFVVFFAGVAPDSVLLSVGLLQSITVHLIPMLAGAPWALYYLAGLRSKPGA